jgi:hypothetical protein
MCVLEPGLRKGMIEERGKEARTFFNGYGMPGTTLTT